MEDSRSQRPEERKEGKDKGRLSVMYTPACLLGHVCFWLTYNLGIRGRDFVSILVLTGLLLLIADIFLVDALAKVSS